MSSRFEAPSSSRFEQLSDCVIGTVLPHGRGRHRSNFVSFEASAPSPRGSRARNSSFDVLTTDSSSSFLHPWANQVTELTTGSRNDATAGLLSLNEASAYGSQPPSPSPPPVTAAKKTSKRTRDSALNEAMTEEEKERILEAKKATRREQLRKSQARFRQKQRDLKMQKQQHLEQDLQQLQEEIQGLKLKRQSLRFRGKSKTSPWSIVSEVFHLLETCFQAPWCVANVNEMKNNIDTRRSLAVLQTTLALDVAMGKLHGFDALTEQLRRYALYFGDPQLQLQRIEAVAPGVVRATATLDVTITEFTLQCLFPHLEQPKSDEEKDEHRVLRCKLLNQRPAASSSMTFLFDEESGLVERLETSIDLLPALARTLGSTEDAAVVMEKALVSLDWVVGAGEKQSERP